MKLTSGRRKQQRQSRALDRLLAAKFEDSRAAREHWDGDPNHIASVAANWAVRRDREAAILRERSGRRFE